jgi:hypothetical protein
MSPSAGKSSRARRASGLLKSISEGANGRDLHELLALAALDGKEYQ